MCITDRRGNRVPLLQHAISGTEQRRQIGGTRRGEIDVPEVPQQENVGAICSGSTREPQGLGVGHEGIVETVDKDQLRFEWAQVQRGQVERRDFSTDALRQPRDQGRHAAGIVIGEYAIDRLPLGPEARTERAHIAPRAR
jgi:hypothetical protein